MTRCTSAVASALLVSILVVLASMPGISGASMSRAHAAKQYLADVKPANAAMKRFEANAGKWNSATTDAQAEKEAAPVVRALRRLQSDLLGQSWPSVARTDIRKLYLSISGLEADLLSLANVNLLNSGAWSSSFDHDLTRLGAEVNLVRHDLGLPLVA